MIIEAEIYGMIPNAKILKRSNAPPENMLNMPKMVLLCSSKNLAIAAGSMPGVGINVPRRKTIKAISTKARRCRSSDPLLSPPVEAAIFARELDIRFTLRCYRQLLQQLPLRP